MRAAEAISSAKSPIDAATASVSAKDLLSLPSMMMSMIVPMLVAAAVATDAAADL
jgi:hypothetical protein